jgi:hypothetical protein
MPEFSSPFTEPMNGRKLTKDELVRAIRFAIAAEYEAVQIYKQIADATDEVAAISVLNSVTDEEKVHAGEFLKLLKELDPEEAKHYEEGEKEATEEMESDTVEESVDKQDWDTGIAKGDKEAFWEYVVCNNEEGCDSGETGALSQKELNRLKREWTGLDSNDKLKWHRLAESIQGIYTSIDEKTVTAEDLNRFITETSPTSIAKRVQRQMRHSKVDPRSTSLERQIDDKTDHKPADHNDPTTTLRGKYALRRQIKRNKRHPEKFQEAIEFLTVNNGKPISECDIKGLNDLASLSMLISRLSQKPSQFEREWLLSLNNAICGVSNV